MLKITMVEARSRLATLPEKLDAEPETGAVAVTRRGKRVLGPHVVGTLPVACGDAGDIKRCRMFGGAWPEHS